MQDPLRQNLLAWSRLLGSDVRRFGQVAAAVHPALTDGFFNYGCASDGEIADDLRQASAWMEERGRAPHFYLSPDHARAARAAGLSPDGGDYVLMAAEATGEPDPAVSAVDAAAVPAVTAMVVTAYPFPERWLSPLTEAYRSAVNSGGRLYAACDDGVPVAALLLVPDGGWAGIYGVVTAPTHRGRGIGTKLVRHALWASRADGCRMATLQVADGSPAERLYRRLGFQSAATVLGFQKR